MNTRRNYRECRAARLQGNEYATQLQGMQDGAIVRVGRDRPLHHHITKYDNLYELNDMGIGMIAALFRRDEYATQLQGMQGGAIVRIGRDRPLPMHHHNTKMH